MNKGKQQNGGCILVADDESRYLKHFCSLFESQGYRTCPAGTPDEIFTRLLSEKGIDVITLDLKWPTHSITGIELLTKIRETDPLTPVVILTSDSSTGSAVEATRQGAFDYLEKVADLDRMLLTLRNAIAAGRRNRAAQIVIDDRQREFELVGASRGMAHVRSAIARYAVADVPVLIEGETGCGKELVARQLHLQSPRSEMVYRSVTAALLGTELGADALFGHTKGAYTGSVEHRPGLLKSTDGGTLCLDDIVTLPQDAQPMLLRFLEGKEYYQIGCDTPINADVRILATTNVSVNQWVEQGTFRNDLYYRLKVASIVIPSLRERREDIPLLADHFVTKHSTKYIGRRVYLAPGCAEIFIDREWPGNVRELENTIIKLLLAHTTSQEIAPDEVLAAIDCGTNTDFIIQGSLKQMEAAFRRTCLIRALTTAHGNVSQAATALGIERTHLYRLINEFGLSGYSKQLSE